VEVVFILSDECGDHDTGGDAVSRDGGVSLSPLSPETRRYWDIRHSATYDGLSRHAVRDVKAVHPQLQRCVLRNAKMLTTLFCNCYSSVSEVVTCGLN
jgi:hypothetical protein